MKRFLIHVSTYWCGMDNIFRAEAKHDVVVDELFFRPVKDYSPGADCKKKIYEDNIKGKYNVQFVLEDNYKCVKMWREQGLVCLQPNEGKF